MQTCIQNIRWDILSSYIEFTIQIILYESEISDYNQNVKLFRAVHSFIKRSKRFDNNIVI